MSGEASGENKKNLEKKICRTFNLLVLRELSPSLGLVSVDRVELVPAELTLPSVVLEEESFNFFLAKR